MEAQGHKVIINNEKALMIRLKSVQVYRKTTHNGIELENETNVNIRFNPDEFKKAVRDVGGHYRRLYPGREIRLIMRDESE